MEKFIYQVAGTEFVDSVAFGDAWKKAKIEAKTLHMPIYRLVIKDEKVKQEVYHKGGCFISTKFVTSDDIAIF